MKAVLEFLANVSVIVFPLVTLGYKSIQLPDQIWLHSCHYKFHKLNMPYEAFEVLGTVGKLKVKPVLSHYERFDRLFFYSSVSFWVVVALLPP